MKIIRDTISITELKPMAEKMFQSLVKAVVDIENEKMAIDAEYHSDEEQLLLDDGSNQAFLWGINLFPDRFGTDDWIEFDSMINMRPWQGNRTRGVEDKKIQEKIKAVVNRLVIL